MNLKKAEIPLYLLAGLILVGIVVLILLNKPVPTYLYVVLAAVLSGGLGIATPNAEPAELPAELKALAGDLHGMFGDLFTSTPAPSSGTVPPPPAPTLTTVPPAKS